MNAPTPSHANKDELLDETRKQRLLDAFDAAHERLIQAATSAWECQIVIEYWTARDILAHIAGWEGEALRRLPEQVNGEDPKEYDMETINRIVTTVLRDLPFSDVFLIMRQTHRRLRQMLDTLEEPVFMPKHPIALRVSAMTNHSVEHARELERYVSAVEL